MPGVWIPEGDLHGHPPMTRIRVGFALTTLLGFVWGVAGVFAPTPTQFLTGCVVAAVGAIGWDVCERLS